MQVVVPISKVSIISTGIGSLIALPLAAKFPIQQLHSVVCLNGVMNLDFSMKQSLLHIIHTLTRDDVPLLRFQQAFRNQCLHFLNKSQYYQSVEDRNLQSTLDDQASLRVKRQKWQECRNVLRYLTVKEAVQQLQGKLAIVQSSEVQFSNRNLSSQANKVSKQVIELNYDDFLNNLGSANAPIVTKVSKRREGEQEIKEIIEKLDQLF